MASYEILDPFTGPESVCSSSYSDMSDIPSAFLSDFLILSALAAALCRLTSCTSLKRTCSGRGRAHISSILPRL